MGEWVGGGEEREREVKGQGRSNACHSPSLDPNIEDVFARAQMLRSLRCTHVEVTYPHVSVKR